MRTIKEMKDWLENVEIAKRDASSCAEAHNYDPGNQKGWFRAVGEIDHLDHLHEVTLYKVETQGLCLTYADDDTEAHETLRALHDACNLEDTVSELRDWIGEMPDDSEEEGDDSDA